MTVAINEQGNELASAKKQRDSAVERASRLEDQNKTRDKELAALRAQIAKMDKRLEERDRELQERTKEVTEKGRQLAEMGTELMEKDKRLASAKANIAELEKEAIESAKTCAIVAKIQAEMHKLKVDGQTYDVKKVYRTHSKKRPRRHADDKKVIKKKKIKKITTRGHIPTSISNIRKAKPHSVKKKNKNKNKQKTSGHHKPTKTKRGPKCIVDLSGVDGDSDA